jgi:hypothetical protein
MAIVRLKDGVTLNLERSLRSAGKHGIWEFYRAANSYMRLPNYTPFRPAVDTSIRP